MSPAAFQRAICALAARIVMRELLERAPHLTDAQAVRLLRARGIKASRRAVAACR